MSTRCDVDTIIYIWMTKEITTAAHVVTHHQFPTLEINLTQSWQTSPLFRIAPNLFCNPLVLFRYNGMISSSTKWYRCENLNEAQSVPNTDTIVLICRTHWQWNCNGSSGKRGVLSYYKEYAYWFFLCTRKYQSKVVE